MEKKDYKVVLVYEDGSWDEAMVAVADVASVMMISRGWLLTAAGAIYVWYCQPEDPSVRGCYVR